MSKYVILYRIKDEYDGCRYIELNSDGTIYVDGSGKPAVSNARCWTRIYEDFEDVETWLTEDVFKRMKNTDGNDTFSDVADMIAHGEHKEFETYVRESEIEKMCEEYGLDEEDVVVLKNGATSAKVDRFNEDGSKRDTYTYTPMTDEEIRAAQVNIEYDKYEEIYREEHAKAKAEREAKEAQPVVEEEPYVYTPMTDEEIKAWLETL